ncbi:cytochrome P450 [Streptantibioticus ferralitis]|uniref:Cytochrome P450 n=1 Tax=Streptantibioticus ferralitis TaxID=236510 RepID=A0ABT5YW13_9ACTN|nr:cytochrome P450 [Streptantibioticus ferralitis]MDF2255673.1 cytochrome P450 [Streptantibioticus ferralitis]
MSVTSPTPSAVPLPTRRGCPFDPPDEYGVLRQRQPISRLAFPDGKTGWLFTRYEDVRGLLADVRFSSDRRRASSPVRAFPIRIGDPRVPGSLIGMDPPEHTRYRRLVTRWFTVRRMRELAPRIDRIVADHLAAMDRTGPPVDLVGEFARPIPSLVICELLGVPYGDRTDFQRWTAALFRLDEPKESVFAARDALWEYVRELVVAKRRQPDEALLSQLIHSEDPSAGLTDQELTGVGQLLLIAGHETTANMLALGTFALLCHPEQSRILRERPDLVDNAVEELLRYLTIVQFGIVRVAREDVEVAGVRVRAGETVVASIAAANRDPAQFPEPDELDITRSAAHHIAFGHGVHQCLGQQLARMEMRTAYPALFGRFPALRLAVPADQVPLRDDMFIYGVHRLPVTWQG